MSGIGVTIHGVMLTRFRVRFHLAIPPVVRPAAKLRDQFGPLFEGKVVDRSLNLLHCAHSNAMWLNCVVEQAQATAGPWNAMPSRQSGDAQYAWTDTPARPPKNSLRTADPANG